MNSRLRLIILVLGIAILLCSLVALGYAFWPLGGSQVQATLEPTLFAPP